MRQYFTEPKVLEGLFGIVETLFEVTIRPDTAPVWHPSVRFFRIERRSGADAGRAPGPVLPRPLRAPRQAARRLDGRCARPLAAARRRAADAGRLPGLQFRRPASTAGPALLTHDDVTTLFHEFGHGLQLMLTQVDDLGVSGISGVEWDAVELPSQFMENFCWEWDVLKHLTAHVDTGAPLPRALFDRMLAAQELPQRPADAAPGRARADRHAPACRARHRGRGSSRWPTRCTPRSAVLPAAPFNRWINTFSHIFAGGYAAGYYSYKWAEVLSADAWSAFEESAAPDGVLDVETGRRYREHVLESGGSRSAMESFKAFRGREPRIDALLRHRAWRDAARRAPALKPGARVG